MNGRRALLKAASFGAVVAAMGPGTKEARAQDATKQTREYIVALVRSQSGADPKLRPVQKIEPVIMKAEAPAALENLPLFDHFVGDLHLRYVFDDPRFVVALRARDLKRLGVNRDDLPAIVVENYRRLYPKISVLRPEPSLRVVTNGGQLEPCLMLDGAFWERERAQFGSPELIAVVPGRDVVIFTTREPRQNVELLKHLAVNAYEKAGPQAVSRTVFAWRNYRWEVIA